MAGNDTVIARRIKQARKLIGVSQTTFGEMAGLDRRNANIKMNQYEKGAHEPKYNFVCKLGEAANLPEYFFYIKDDLLANNMLLTNEREQAEE
jgi:transcriptional regulator with XRE-family HTH domain